MFEFQFRYPDPTALFVLWLISVFSIVIGHVSGQEQRPNIVLIMADDMGYTDIGCYGGEIETPVLDSLAHDGIRLTQFYNASRCCPTRASLLTGLYSHQAGVGLMMSDRGDDAYRGDLSSQCVTLAEVLQASGYRTYMSGKWHVTRHKQPDGNQRNWPLQRGFNRFYGTITGAGSFFDPATLCRGNQFITPENDVEYRVKNFYYTDAISENARTYVRDHFAGESENPFFLYVAYTSAHWPMHARPQEIEKYRGRYDDGFDAIRASRYQRAIAQGVLDKQWPMSNTVGNWETVKHKPWDIRNMEVYAAMVDRMDQGIGWIVDEIKRHDAFDNTLIVYLQDNGGCAEGMGRGSNSAKIRNVQYQPFGPDDLQRQIWPPMQTRDGRAVRSGPEVMAGAADTYIAYGRGWANVSNTPFRGYKHDALEGGISTPLILHWPDGISGTWRNSVNDDPCHLIDIMPTLVEVCGASYPETFGGNKILPMEGVSLLPTLKGAAVRRDGPIGFEHHGNLALRDGPWKIVSSYRQGKPTRWELFNMESDRTELNDLSRQYPDMKQKLVAKWQIWADRVGVRKWPFKNGRAKQ